MIGCLQSATALDVKRAVHEKDSSLLPHLQRLVGPGRVKLNDDWKLSEHQIGHGTTLNLVMLTPFNVHIQGTDGRMHIIIVPSSEPQLYTVAALRVLVEKAVGHSMGEYQLHHQGRPVDENRHGRQMLLGDHSIKSDSTLIMTKMGLVLNVTNPKVDVCFLVDCTLSMSEHIEAVKRNIQQLRNKLVEEYKKCDLVFSFVRYTDYNDQPALSRVTFLPFTSDQGKFQRFVTAITPANGVDYPEDVMGGLNVAFSNLAWRPESCKILIHIGDAPCHGSRYCNNMNDRYPSGDPAGISHEAMMKQVVRLDIQYWFGYIAKNYTDQMIGIFNDSLRLQSKQRLIIRQFDAMKCNEVGAAVQRSVVASVYGKAALKIAAVRDFTLNPNVPDWNSPTITQQMAKKTPPPAIKRLSNLQDTELKLEKPNMDFAFKIAPNPFAEGSECLVYHASDLINFRRIVLKRFKQVDGEHNTLECYMKELEVRTISTVYACEFGMEKLKPLNTFSIDFTQLDIVQCAGGVHYILEPFLTGKIEKFNNNSGVVAKCPPHSDLLQAFSHYTWVKSGKTLLVCDLQGFKEDARNRIVLTDPAIHSNGEGGRYGAMDCGLKGVQMFFNTHVCSTICSQMKLAGQFI